MLPFTLYVMRISPEVALNDNDFRLSPVQVSHYILRFSFFKTWCGKAKQNLAKDGVEKEKSHVPDHLLLDMILRMMISFEVLFRYHFKI